MRKLIVAAALACAASSPAFSAVILSENFNNFAAYAGGSLLSNDTSDNWNPTNYYFINSPVNGFSFDPAATFYATNGAGSDGAVLLNENGGLTGGTASVVLSGLTPGTVYTLTFNVFGDNVVGQPYGLAVSVDGTPILTYAGTDQTAGFYGGTGGPSLTALFTTAGTSATLLFAQTTPSGSGASPIIDNVLVVSPAAVPEPVTGALVLAGFGLMGAGAAGRRTRKS